jgi:hypothetical protein
LRRDLDPDMEVEVEILDVTEDEARQLLLSIDPPFKARGWSARCCCRRCAADPLTTAEPARRDRRVMRLW